MSVATSPHITAKTWLTAPDEASVSANVAGQRQNRFVSIKLCTGQVQPVPKAIFIFPVTRACKTIQISIHHRPSIQSGIFLGRSQRLNIPLRSAAPLSKAGEFIMKPIVTLRRLTRSLLAASVVATAVTGFSATAQAQSQSYAQRTSPSAPSMAVAEWNGRSVARTGATVPNPGTAKIGPQTEVERRGQERSARAIRTICIGCL
jgi:hypothetical protein